MRIFVNSRDRVLARVLLVAAMVSLTACGGTEGGESVRTVSIRTLKSLYAGYPVRITEPLEVRGVVVGTDRYGEQSGQLVVQDHTGGITFSIDNRNLHETYSLGDSLHIGCVGLTLGGYGKAVRVGEGPADGYETSPIGWARWCEIATDCGVGQEPKPHVLNYIGDLGPHHIATLVRLSGVRFVEGGEPLAEEGVATTRHLVGPSEGVGSLADTLEVRASGRSDFHSLLLPVGECSVVGIAGYFHDAYQLVIVSPDDIFPE